MYGKEFPAILTLPVYELPIITLFVTLKLIIICLSVFGSIVPTQILDKLVITSTPIILKVDMFTYSLNNEVKLLIVTLYMLASPLLIISINKLTFSPPWTISLSKDMPISKFGSTIFTSELTSSIKLPFEKRLK